MSVIWDNPEVIYSGRAFRSLTRTWAFERLRPRAIQIIPLAMAHVKTSRHLLISNNVAVTPISKTYMQRGSLELGTTRRLPGTRNRRVRKHARQEHLMLDVVMLAALGLGFFLVAVDYTNASGENENDFRLFARCRRRCRLAVFLALRAAAA
jgi:hypothetical protein